MFKKNLDVSDNVKEDKKKPKSKIRICLQSWILTFGSCEKVTMEIEFVEF